jgi:HEPN domain-containing protein
MYIKDIPKTKTITEFWKHLKQETPISLVKEIVKYQRVARNRRETDFRGYGKFSFSFTTAYGGGVEEKML